MAKLCPLFSGSSGNSIYISYNGQGILIDAGRSARQIERALVENNLDIKEIKNIFITHEHTDHISGLRVLASKYNIDVYASEGTINFMRVKGTLDNRFYSNIIGDSGINIGNMHVYPFSISHDCCEGLGYIVKLSNGIKIGICTDLGYVTDTVYNSLLGCKVLVIESNHDINMLQNGKYPYYLKRRILSNRGHLSNESCANLLVKMVQNGTSRILLSHLSSENNIPELAYETSLSTLKLNNMKLNLDFTLNIAPEFNSEMCSILF